MKIKLFIIFFVCLPYFVNAQIKNQRDAAGLKQGYWEAVDSKGNLVYTGYFKDDTPVGEMKRFYSTGELRQISNYTDSGIVRVKLFLQDGALAAQGNYINTQRDSIWLFYNFQNTLSSRVEYIAGKRNGTEQRFYPDGTSIIEEFNWKNDLKDGSWKQYFINEQVKSIGTYINGKLEGQFKSYNPDGKTELEGTYLNGLPNGDWKRYDDNGNYLTTIKYEKGFITNMDELEDDDIFFFMKEQEQYLPEPTLEDLFK